MVVLNKITTKTGDDGTTGLANGERRLKSDARVEAYGTIDEANAAIGVARCYAAADLRALLADVQNDLFDLGADLSTPDGGKLPSLRISEAQVARLEREADTLNAMISPLTSFVLPGGSASAAHLHHARTIARRAERLMVGLAQREQVSRPALVYINRLSDFLFIAARYANECGRSDQLWVPGANRGPAP